MSILTLIFTRIKIAYYLVFRDGPEPLPYTVSHILRNRNAVIAQYPPQNRREWRVSLRRQCLLSRLCGLTPRDSISAAFYRIYEFLILDWVNEFRNHLEYFFAHHKWSVASIPDPLDPNPVRYAALAALTKLSFDKIGPFILNGTADRLAPCADLPRTRSHRPCLDPSIDPKH
ncbi:hypothetical protein CPB85DRAFT_1436358 [Mucidula mucida]|nr:hypothetical protein CPB85DRAFT_1436358 [Mucidula mucida]